MIPDCLRSVKNHLPTITSKAHSIEMSLTHHRSGSRLWAYAVPENRDSPLQKGFHETRGDGFLLPGRRPGKHEGTSVASPEGAPRAFKCRYCHRRAIRLQTAYGGWRLFDARMFPTDVSFRGNRFAIDRRSRLVIDLDNVHETRWPAQCLRLHRFQCPQTFETSRE